MAETGTDIHKAKAILEAGGLVAIPTETVYGLAANATNGLAVAKIFEAKKRPSFDPLIVHTNSFERVREFVHEVPLDIELVLRTFSPGPVTVLLEKNEDIPDITTSGLRRVGVRIPRHPLTLQLLENLDFPLAAPSANPFGYISPTTAKHVADQLGDQVDYILDGGACEVGLESTILGYEGEDITIYRKGGLEIEKIEELLGKVNVRDHSSSNPAAPGMLKSHYAPNKEVLLLNEKLSVSPDSGFLRFKSYIAGISESRQFILSSNGDLKEAAQNLFKALRSLDNLPVENIYIEMVPEHGLGAAINDRLRRALAKD